MEQIKEKVRDLVDVRRYTGISNFPADPGSTLEKYHFTDGTANLMVKWLGGVSVISATGECRAIAGYRGVGKSHFLAAFEAIVAHPELRSKIEDGYVASGAQELLRRHYPVVHVQRGSAPTLISEMADAVARQFNLEASGLGTLPDEILAEAKKHSGDLPLIVVIDTASDRGGQVVRNDGRLLGEIASFCVANGIFLGLALDDDIAGADGDNVAISDRFSIDYLDQEHLYKAVNAKVFVKDSRKQPSIQKLYFAIRDSTPGFRWSEERFSSLYPLHPVTLEITPFIRRYIPGFSLLKFASESGEKILARPADSLIGIEDLFDSTELELRRNEELRTAFEIFDSIQTDHINKLPVNERHRTKLILKALFLLSLVGTGASGAALVPALLIRDDQRSEEPKNEIARVLDSFAGWVPDSVTADRTNPESVVYTISTGKDRQAAELARWIESQPKRTSDQAFLKAASLVFSEFDSSNSQVADQNLVRLSLDWRGSSRPGILIFGEDDIDSKDAEPASEFDWVVFFDGSESRSINDGEAIKLVWKPDQLKPDEAKAIVAFYGLSTERSLRDSFGDQLSSAEHAHRVAAKLIAERTLLQDARLFLDGNEQSVPDSASGARSLKEWFSLILEPVFETKYPFHPIFPEPLTVETVDRFVNAVYGNSIELSAEGEVLARSIGVPLGIIVGDESGLRRASREELLKIECVKKLSDVMDARGMDPIAIDEIGDIFRQEPFGLSRESRSLLLAAMASNGLIELVTIEGNRINGRSLDLKIEWTNVAAVARPRSSEFSDECLEEWAGVIVGDKSNASIKQPQFRSRIIDSLIDISRTFKNASTPKVNRFEPEFAMSTFVGSHTNRVVDNYQRIIADVEDTLAGSIDLEECVGRISASFGDNIDAFRETQRSAVVFDSFSRHCETVEKIRDYLAACEFTGSELVEMHRDAVNSALSEFDNWVSDSSGEDVNRSFEQFLGVYSDHYVSEHQRIMQSGAVRSALDEIFRSVEWRKCGSLIALEPFRSEWFPQIRGIRRLINRINCANDPASTLQSRPACVCSFRLSEADMFESLPARLRSTIDDCLRSFQQIVFREDQAIMEHLMSMSQNEWGSMDAIAISMVIAEKQGLDELSSSQFEILAEAYKRSIQ